MQSAVTEAWALHGYHGGAHQHEVDAGGERGGGLAVEQAPVRQVQRDQRGGARGVHADARACARQGALAKEASRFVQHMQRGRPLLAAATSQARLRLWGAGLSHGMCSGKVSLVYCRLQS